MQSDDRDYYCRNKFNNIKIDLESFTTYTCHAARPHTIDFEWLHKNPGQIFNSPVNVLERTQMLRNERNSSCEQNCWPAEDRASPSPRLISKGQFRTHTDIISQAEIVDITLNSDCGLTCSYCCKEFSSSWRNDIIKNGNYDIDSERDRYSLTQRDLIINRLSQPERINSQSIKQMIDEINKISSTAKKLIISGGEPFLSKYLVDVVEKKSHVPKIQIFTGLGVDYKRFQRIIDVLADHKNVVIYVSAESTGSCYEFNRYGMRWDDFLRKMELLEKKNMQIGLTSVMSNLTVLGFADFYRMFDNKKIRIECVYNPNFLAPHVLDPNTKQIVMQQIDSIDFAKKQIILDSMNSNPTQQEHRDLAKFLHEFVRRRHGLTLDCFPKTFQNWVKNVV
jgi:organic radical activating enzyme